MPSSHFNPLPDGYEHPSIKIEIDLKPYDKPPTTKTPVMVGYMKLSKLHLEALSQVLEDSPGSVVRMRVAMWDDHNGGLTGNVEYKEYGPPVDSKDRPEPSVWY